MKKKMVEGKRIQKRDFLPIGRPEWPWIGCTQEMVSQPYKGTATSLDCRWHWGLGGSATCPRLYSWSQRKFQKSSSLLPGPMF